jgi:hypothetical protein
MAEATSAAFTPGLPQVWRVVLRYESGQRKRTQAFLVVGSTNEEVIEMLHAQQPEAMKGAQVWTCIPCGRVVETAY